MGDISEHFSRVEMKCKCGECENDTADVELIRVLEEIRIHFKRPVVINSGNRCTVYNKKVGGADKSQHLLGRAADIVIHNIPPDKIYNFLNDRYPTKYGLGSYPSFCHIDTRVGFARW